jgi:DNA invertase Pin-like site-specific DNA recombinase
MPTAFSYIRFSSAQQQHGASLARQHEYIARWLITHTEYNLSGDSFKDLGISGYSGKHLDNGFGKLLAAIETGAIKAGDVVLIEAIDRVGRLEPMEMLPLLSRIVNAGVDIVTLDDGITYNRESVNSNHLFLLVAKVQQAHQYSDSLSRRVKDAYSRKREKAAGGGGAKRRTPLWLDQDGVLVEDVAPFIVQIFQDYADGIGERRILARIRGKHPLLETLNPTTIKKWLNNPTAIGRWQPWPVDGVEQAPIEDVYPAVVSKELWHRVQKRLAAGARIKSASALYLLSGLVKCGRCGKNFGVVNTKRSPAVMLCMGRHRLGEAGCSNSRSIPMHVLDFVRSQTMYGAMLRAAASQNLTSGEKRMIEIDGELTELRRRESNAAEAVVQYGMSKVFTDVLDKVLVQIDKLEEEKALLKVTPAPSTLDDMIDLQHTLMDDDEQRLNALLQGVGYAIVCNGTTITVNEPHMDTVGDCQVYEYKGSHRPTETYRVIENNHTEHHLDMPNSKRVAAAIAEFEATPITQHLRWNGTEFVEESA